MSRKPSLVEKFEEANFLRKVRSVFLSRAKSENYPVVDTSGSIDKTQDKIRNIVASFLKKL